MDINEPSSGGIQIPMDLGALFKFGLMLIFLSGISEAISLSCSSGDSIGESSIGAKYDLDISTGLDQSITVGDGEISSIQSAKGSGKNSIVQTASGQESTVSSSMTSTGNMASASSSYASGDVASVGQTVQATGQSESSISASSNSLDVESNQRQECLAASWFRHRRLSPVTVRLTLFRHQAWSVPSRSPTVKPDPLITLLR